MPTKQRSSKLASMAATASRGRRLVLLVLCAALLPTMLAYYVTGRMGEAHIRQETQRVSDFLIVEAERLLSDSERVLDGYLHQTGGSCLARDLSSLAEFIATRGSVLSVGVVAPDGNIACKIGQYELNGVTFPKLEDNDNRQPVIAELRRGGRSLPLIIKRSKGDMRAFALISGDRFSSLLLPEFFVDYAQIDIILPRGGLWYSLTGNLVTNGFSSVALALENVSERFPITANLVVDHAAARTWSKDLQNMLIVVMMVCVTGFLTVVLLAHFMRIYVKRRRRAKHAQIAKAATELFKITYQPVVTLDSGLLVGAIARVDLSLFDQVPEHRPPLDEIIEMIWQEIGDFAQRRREFQLIIEVDGDVVLDPEIREPLIAKLGKINYPNLVLLMRWSCDKGVDPSLYRALEQISTAGTMFALECGNVKFSFLSDMWAWPYHKLMIDFSELPPSDEAALWLGEIVLNMADQLHVDPIAIGLKGKASADLAMSTGFETGTGEHVGPSMPIEAFLAVVRPVATASVQNDGAEQASTEGTQAAA
ncbi:MAG: hypothetical protein AAFW47_04065 [Pseudomonadota bacterium]